MIQRIVAKVSNPITMKALEILDAAKEAVQQLGQPNAQDAQAKIDWMSEATAVDAQLQQQLDALDQLLTQSQTPKRKALKTWRRCWTSYDSRGWPLCSRRSHTPNP